MLGVSRAESHRDGDGGVSTQNCDDSNHDEASEKFSLSSPNSDCFAGSRENQNTMITMPI